MKTILMGCGCLTLIGILLVGGGIAFFGWKAMDSIPPDAKREVLFAANRNLIERIDGIIANTENLETLPQALSEGIDENRVIYLKLEELATGWNRVAIKRQEWDSQSVSTFTLNGAGWGTLSTGKFDRLDIRVISSSARTKNGHEIHYTLYLDHTPKVEK